MIYQLSHWNLVNVIFFLPVSYDYIRLIELIYIYVMDSLLGNLRRNPPINNF